VSLVINDELIVSLTHLNEDTHGLPRVVEVTDDLSCLLNTSLRSGTSCVLNGTNQQLKLEDCRVPIIDSVFVI